MACIARLASSDCLSHRQISISPTTLVCTLAFPVKVSMIHLCTQADSIKKCSIVASPINANDIASAKFMCCTSFSFRNQLASSIAVPSYSSETPVASELASTQTSNLGASTHHLPYMRSFVGIIEIISSIIVVNGTSFTLSFQPSVTAAAILFVNAAATLCHLITEKWSTSLPHCENTVRGAFNNFPDFFFYKHLKLS